MQEHLEEDRRLYFDALLSETSAKMALCAHAPDAFFSSFRTALPAYCTPPRFVPPAISGLLAALNAPACSPLDAHFCSCLFPAFKNNAMRISRDATNNGLARSSQEAMVLLYSILEHFALNCHSPATLNGCA